MTDREQVERDLEQFAARREALAEVVRCAIRRIDRTIYALRQITEMTTGPSSFEAAGFHLVDVTRQYRRIRIRAAARARKARRGWR